MERRTQAALNQDIFDASRIQEVLERDQLQKAKRRKQRRLEFAYFFCVAILAIGTFVSDMNAEVRFYKRCRDTTNCSSALTLCDGSFYHAYLGHGILRIVVSLYLSRHLIPLLRYYYDRITWNAETFNKKRRASIQKKDSSTKSMKQRKTMSHQEAKLLLEAAKLDTAGNSRLDGRLEPLDWMKTDQLQMAYLWASYFVVAVDMLGLALALWRTDRNGIDPGWSTSSFISDECKNAQGALVLQLLFSALSLAKPKDLFLERKELLRIQLKHSRDRREIIQAIKQDSTEIKEFKGVKKGLIKGMLRLRVLLGDAVKRTARDIAGDVMLLRYLTKELRGNVKGVEGENKIDVTNIDSAKVVSTAAVILRALKERDRCGANAARERILRDDLSYDTIPDADKLQRVFPHNMFLGYTKKNDILRYEAWGAANPRAIAEKWHRQERVKQSRSRWNAVWLFLEELQNLNLVEESHRQKAVRRVVLLVDASGLSPHHEKLAECLRARSEQRHTIYPGMIAEVVVANASFGNGNAIKILKSLDVTSKSAVLVDSEGYEMHRRSSSMRFSKHSLSRAPSKVFSRSTSTASSRIWSSKSLMFTSDSTVAPLVNPQNPLFERFDAEIVPKDLGGTNVIGVGARCCGGVSHDTVNKTLGSATLLRTFEDVSEDEVKNTGDLREALVEESNVHVASLPPHVGGDVALLKFLRKAKNDVGDAKCDVVEHLRRRREEFHFDLMLQNILKNEMSFSDLPYYSELQAVWPHNPDLGRTDTGEIVMYEAWGQIKVDDLLRQFPLGMGILSRQENPVGPKEWEDALLLANGEHKEIAEYLKEFDAVCRSDADTICRSSEELSRRTSSWVFDRCIEDLKEPDGPVTDAEEPNEWSRIHRQINGMETEIRKTTASRFRQLRFSTSLPYEIDDQVIDAEKWFTMAVQSLGTRKSIAYGDNSVIQDLEMERIDDNHAIYWRANTMSRGMRDRDMVTLAYIDRKHLTFYAKSVPGLDELVDKTLGIEDQEKSLVRAEALGYGFRVVPANGKACRFIAFEHIDPRGNAPARLVNRDWVSLGRAQGYVGLLDRLITLVSDADTTGSAGIARASSGFAISPNAFVENVTYRHELLSLLQDRISREKHRIVKSILVVDMHGLKSAHRRVIPYVLKVDAINLASTNWLEIILNVATNELVKTLMTAISPVLPETTKNKMIFLRTEGDSHAAKAGRSRLNDWVPKKVLPRSLGGTATFGLSDDCCTEVKHVSFLKIKEFTETDLLDAFSNIGPGDIAAASQLHLDIQEKLEVDIRAHPAHILGGVALVRVVLSDVFPLTNEIKTMLKLREKHQCDSVHQEILQHGYHLNNLPGSSELQAATYHSNEWLATDLHGSIVSYHRWGAIDPSTFTAQSSQLEQFQSWMLYRFEALALVLDLLSRRNARIVQYANLIDMGGATLQHRTLVPMVKEFATGKATKPYNSLWQCAGTTVLNMGQIAVTLFGLVKPFLRKNVQVLEQIALVSVNPFETSMDFEERFARFQLPSCVGNGTLQIGTNKYCCLGVELPSMRDETGLLTHYKLEHSRIQGTKAMKSMRRKSSSGLARRRSLLAERLNSDKITKMLRREARAKQNDTQHVEVLLLGTGNAGKSTIFKQMELAHSVKYEDPSVRSRFTEGIQRNVIELLKLVVRRKLADAFMGQDDAMMTDESFKARTKSDVIQNDLSTETRDLWNAMARDDALPWLVSAARKAWFSPNSGLCEKLRSMIDECSPFLPSNARYMASRVGDVLDVGGVYVPSVEDVLNVRIPTFGVKTAELKVKEQIRHRERTMILYDPGGQQNQRKKWIHLFAHTNSVLYVLSLASYTDKSDSKGSHENALMESLRVLRELATEPLLADSHFVVFLNKEDVFREKIEHFSMRNFISKAPKGNDADKGIRYIKKLVDRALGERSRNTEVHVVTATDVENANKALTSMSVSIAREYFEVTGFGTV